MIHHVFVFGVLIPTLITISVFIAFLICWFKFNMKDRFFKKQLKHQKKHSIPGQPLETVAPPSISAHKNPSRGPTPLPYLDPNPPEPPDGAGVLHTLHSHSTEFPDDVCSIEDPEAALCSHAVAVDNSRYYSDTTAEVELIKELPSVAHVTQTFHFPELTKVKRVEVMDSELGFDDDGSGNYGHFVHMLDTTAAESEALAKQIQCAIHQGVAVPKAHTADGLDIEGGLTKNMNTTQLVQETGVPKSIVRC